MSPNVQVRHFSALGSTCELIAVGASPAALERCQALVLDADARLTRFARDSELSQLNAAKGRPMPASPLLYGMLEAGLHAYEASGGLVNIAVLPALCAAGYDRPFRLGLSQPSSLTPPVTPALPGVLWLDPATRTVALAPGAALALGGSPRAPWPTCSSPSWARMRSAISAVTCGCADQARAATAGTSGSAMGRSWP